MPVSSGLQGRRGDTDAGTGHVAGVGEGRPGHWEGWEAGRPTYTVCEREGRRGSGGTSGWVRTEGVHEEGPDVCIVARRQKPAHTVKQLYFN